MAETKCVWVLEGGVFHATQDRISRWEVLSAHNLRTEAVEERNRCEKPNSTTQWKRIHKQTLRIRKYVPAEDTSNG